MNEHHRPTTLLTGATGFLGQFILRELLRRGRRVVVLLRTPLSESSRRLSALMSGIGEDLSERMKRGEVLMVEGGLPAPLPDPDWGRTDDILHCAASLRLFTNGTNDPFTTNVEGARALIEWAERNQVSSIHAVSTAYVCGMNEGLIAEAPHAPQPEFQTHYEHSKWIAESEFQSWRQRTGGTLTIFRPSFVVGDSETGYTTQFGGFYQLARLVSMLKRRDDDRCNGNGDALAAGRMERSDADSDGDDETYVPLRIPLQPDARHNVVPVDYSARLIAAGVVDPRFHGSIYHVADPDPPTNDFWKKCFEVAFHLHGGYFVDPRTTNGARSPEEAMLWEQIDVLVPRLRHTPRFCTRNAQCLARAAGLTYPALSTSRVLSLLRYAVESEWGKRSAVRRAVGRNGKGASVSVLS